MNDGKVSTGITRLDELLVGGLPTASNVLLYGPPFVGKEVIMDLFTLSGLRSGIPAIIVLTDTTAAEKRREFEKMEPDYPGLEEAGLVVYVDSYSRSIGDTSDDAHTIYVDGNVNLNAIGVAVNDAQSKLLGKGDYVRLSFDSISTLIAFVSAPATFRFLQILAGRLRSQGSVAYYTLEKGMHTDTEVQMFKHLMGGVMELMEDNAQTMLRVQGIGDVATRDWGNYEFGPGRLDLIGSFAIERVR